MTFDIRKVAIIFIIAVLFSIFTFTTIDAIYPTPEYNDYCNSTIYSKQLITKTSCVDVGGNWIENPELRVASLDNQYDCTKINEQNNNITLNCKIITQETNGYCESTFQCQKDFDQANNKQKLVLFLIATISGLIAIIAGIYLSPEKNEINNWIATGFMLGGLINIFFGTVFYFQYTDRIYRPLIIFLELALIIFITYKKIGKK